MADTSGGSHGDRPTIEMPVNAAAEVLGEPRVMLVLDDIVFGNRRHFREAG